MKKLQIIHEDNHLLAINKPSGLLTQGDDSGAVALTDLAKAYIKEKYEKPGNVFLGLLHRIDRPVSGVVLLARTSKAAARVSKQFSDKKVKKIYLAVVAGMPSKLSGTLVHQMGKKQDRQGKTPISSEKFRDSREAVLKYRVLSSDGNRSLVEVKPISGRRHQIRAQLSEFGYPIEGDLKYGSKIRIKDRSIALHALQVTFDHPVLEKQVVIKAKLPATWPWKEA
jgi:23S rRNA pseudouridine1911/1915/1917 synthase